MDRKFSAPLLKTVPLASIDSPAISVSAYVELDRGGQVQHVLLEQPSGVSNVDAAVVRSLWAGTGQPGAGPASGHVKIYCWKRD